MKGFLNLLAKARLIELSDEERALAEAGSPAATGGTPTPATAGNASDLPPPAASRPADPDDPLALPPLAPPPVATADTGPFRVLILGDSLAATGFESRQ